MGKILPTDIVNQTERVSNLKFPSINIVFKFVCLHLDDLGGHPTNDCLKDGETIDVVDAVVKLYDDDQNVVKGRLWKISAEIVRKFVPTRLWYDKMHNCIVMMYYTSEQISYRPFVEPDEDVYVFVTPLECPFTYRYDGRARVVIDQFMIGTEMHCVFVFGSQEADLMLLSDE